MLRGILIIAAVAVLAVLSHRRSRLEERVLKNVPLSDWLIILVFPLFLYLGWVAIVKHILDRPFVYLFPLDDFDILALTILFLVYGFVGNAIHFNGKIIWRYLKGFEDTMVYRVNEIFHGKLSHYLTYLNSLFILFLLPLLEINHPLVLPVTRSYMIVVSISGVIFGISAGKAVFYTNEWFGGYNKPLFFLVGVLLATLLVLILLLDLSFRFYPINLFVISMFSGFIVAFILRQIFIFAKLSSKRKLRFLAKILHA